MTPSIYQIETQAREFASSFGVTLPANLLCDATIHRFHIDGRKPGNRDGWYLVHIDGCPNWVIGVHGRSPDDGWHGKFDFKTAGLSAAVPTPHGQQQEAEDARQKEQATATERARAIYENAGPADPNHTYVNPPKNYMRISQNIAATIFRVDKIVI
jgi:putative DNA primase/helicase